MSFKEQQALIDVRINTKEAEISAKLEERQQQRELRNALAPCSHLPPEVFCKILRHLMLDCVFGAVRRVPKMAWIKASHVL
jgi:hypothetical protein